MHSCYMVIRFAWIYNKLMQEETRKISLHLHACLSNDQFYTSIVAAIKHT